MGNVIQWADAVKALATIAAEQQAVAGMSVAEAAAALNYTKTASGMYLKTVMSTTAQSVIGTTATSVAGAGGAAVTTAVNLTLVEGAGGTATVAGIGSIALPVAACVAAAGGGYLIGKELNKNEAYSGFFDNLVYKTCDFVTGQSLADSLLNEQNNEEPVPVIPLLYDAYGNAYLPSELTYSVKNYLDTLDDPLLSSASALVARDYAIIIGPFDGTVFYLLTSDSPFFMVPYQTTKYKLDTSTHYGDSWKSTDSITWTRTGRNSVITMTTSTSFAPFIRDSTADVLFNGNVIFLSNWDPTTIPGALPGVITKYTPATPTITPITDPNGATWTRVYLPSAPPTEMADGEPVPTTPSDPERLTPYIPPFQPQPVDVPLVLPPAVPVNPIIIPNPEPNTSTAPYPPPNPNLDPSQLAEPVPPPASENLPEPLNSGSPTLPLLPSVPSPSSTKGLLHVYNPTPAQVDLFGEWLWTTFSGDIIDTISKLFNNPMDAVIGLHELYCTPAVSSADVNIRAGYLDSNVPSRLVTSRYKEIKCGALLVPEYWGNYLDYSPYTKSYCYLPFIGIVELNTDDIVGSGVEITYRIDTYNGSCIALITTAKTNSAESVTYQYEGNCSVSVPITSGMMTAVQNALIGVATTALSAGATAAVTAATGGAALPAAGMLATIGAGASKQGLTSKNQVQHSGSFGSSFGAMGIKIPFLIIKRPRQKVVHGYNTNYGYPAHKMVLISTCTGYLKAHEVDVISPTATEAEKKMIQEALKSGVFID